MLTGFIQINTNHTVSADANSSEVESHVFDLHKNLGLTDGLTSTFSYDTTQVVEAKKQKSEKIKVNAIKLDEKTIVIKGFNESIDETLLKTIDLDINSIGAATTSVDESFGYDIVPVTIDIATDDVVEELNDDSSDIVEYEVASGDNISSIAQKFNISPETILWANDLTSKSSI